MTFNAKGDFVDRGSFSVEVILTFLLFKIHDPTCIYLTRGNHETKNMNRIYGFEGEVRHKYDDKIFELFLEVFGHLPLAATVAGKVFVTHGGLSTREDVMLDDIRKIKRGMEPPESGLMSDLLWSDPQPFPGKSPSKVCTTHDTITRDRCFYFLKNVQWSHLCICYASFS